MKKLILSSILFLSGCWGLASPQTKEVTYNPQEQARVRLYGQHNYPTIIRTENFVASTGGMRGGSFTGMIGHILSPLESISIGIPKTEQIDFMNKQRSSITAGLYYEEYIVPANKLYTIFSSYDAKHEYCSVYGDVEFKNGNDYEILSYIQKDKCIIEVHHIIQSNNGKVSFEIVPLLKTKELK